MREQMTFENDIVVGEVVKKEYISKDDINTVICGWMESSYSELYTSSTLNGFKNTEDYNKYYWSDYATKMLLDGKELMVEVLEENGVHILTLEKLLKGFQLNSEKRQNDDFFNGNHDAVTYDCIIQYALFGEIVYG